MCTAFRFELNNIHYAGYTTCMSARIQNGTKENIQRTTRILVARSHCHVATSSNRAAFSTPRPKPAATALNPFSFTSARNTSCWSASRSLFLRISRMTPCARAQFGHSVSWSARQLLYRSVSIRGNRLDVHRLADNRRRLGIIGRRAGRRTAGGNYDGT